VRAGDWRRYGTAALLLTLTACGAEAPLRPAPGLPPGEDVAVRDVVDGDTVVVDGGRTVRLLGVDTPETVHPERAVECYGPEASAYLAGLVPAGTAVRLVAGAEPRDRYGRTLAWVHRAGDGLFVNAALVRDGYARPLSVPPNDRFTGELESLAARARAAGSGLWGACEEDE
jgi:micrococcal nuclease